MSDDFNPEEINRELKGTHPPVKKPPKPKKDPARQRRGRTSRNKGKAFERWVVKFLQDAGISDAHRRFGDKASGDAAIGAEKLECKTGYGGFKTIRRWLSGNYAVVYRPMAEHSSEGTPEALVFMRLKDFAELALEAEAVSESREEAEAERDAERDDKIRQRAVKRILRTRVRELEGALERIRDYDIGDPGTCEDTADWMAQHAGDALEGKADREGER